MRRSRGRRQHRMHTCAPSLVLVMSRRLIRGEEAGRGGALEAECWQLARRGVFLSEHLSRLPVRCHMTDNSSLAGARPPFAISEPLGAAVAGALMASAFVGSLYLPAGSLSDGGIIILFLAVCFSL